MKNVSALENIHKHGLFGNHDSKDEIINIRGNQGYFDLSNC